jgi:protease-4
MQSSTRWFLIIVSLLLVIGAGGVLIIYLIAIGTSSDETETSGGYGDRVAIVELNGTIISSEATVKLFKKYRDDHSVRAIVFRIESPGGGVVASQEIYEEVRKTRSLGIPVVVSMGSVAASGGYYVACGGTKIMANPGTLTGSIGVISQMMRYDPLLDKIGVTVTTIKSGKMKDAGNPFREMTADDKAYFQKLMDEVHSQFMGVVEKERKLDHEKTVALADGRVFTGVEALGEGLVDSIGTYEDAIRLAADMGGIKGEPTILREKKRRASVLDMLTGESKISELLNLKEELLGQPILQYRMAPGF